MGVDELDQRRNEVINMMREIQERHRRELQPFLEELALIERMRPIILELPLGHVPAWVSNMRD